MPALTAPVRLNHLRHGLGTLGLGAPTADKMAGEFFFFLRRHVPGFAGAGQIAGAQELFGFGKIAGLGIGACAAELALDDAAMAAVG